MFWRGVIRRGDAEEDGDVAGSAAVEAEKERVEMGPVMLCQPPTAQTSEKIWRNQVAQLRRTASQRKVFPGAYTVISGKSDMLALKGCWRGSDSAQIFFWGG